MGLLAAAGGSRASLSLLSRMRDPDDPRLATEVFGLRFRNALGLAAGFDKDARAVPALSALGFGFVEVGTVTPRPQPGNPRPRVFRLSEDAALVNRLGFNSQGAAAVAERLESLEEPAALRSIIGVNIGKNRDTPTERAPSDYVRALLMLGACGDYVAVNVSSPNTVGLRDLLAAERLTGLLTAVLAAEKDLATQDGRDPRPVLVKISPDLAEADLDATLDAAADAGAAGFIASNTTIARPAELHGPARAEAGGLSGSPLFPRTLEVVRHAYRRYDGKLPIVGVGGVTDGHRALQLIRAGASLVQAYTGLVYGGPGFPRQLLSELAGLLSRSGFRTVADAVGSDA